MTSYVCDLTAVEIRALTLAAGSYEIAPETVMTVFPDSTWAVAADGVDTDFGNDRDSAIVYLLDLRASYERVAG